MAQLTTEEALNLMVEVEIEMDSEEGSYNEAE